MKKSTEIAVVGAGAWGTALAVTLARNDYEIVLWSRNSEVIRSINNQQRNDTYLPGIKIPDGVNAVRDFKKLENCQIIFLATPAQNQRMVCKALKELGLTGRTLVICSKGIEQESLQLMSQVVEEELPGNTIAVLSGPNFADEIASGLPAAATLGCKDEAKGLEVAKLLSSDSLRVYCSTDVIGVEVGGAVKNVIAIACGIASGKKLGENARAALITRGLAEISRLSKALGGKPETLVGLSGMGDLMLTCCSPKSRNMSLGISLGERKDLQFILSQRPGKVTEGIPTCQSVVELAKKLNIEMPICEAVHAILYKQASIDETIKTLLKRPVKNEIY